MSIKSENIEILKEVLEVNTDVFFKYRDKKYFWTVFGYPEPPRRCLRNGKYGSVIKYFNDDIDINTPIIDGKSFMELAEEIEIIDVY